MQCFQHNQLFGVRGWLVLHIEFTFFRWPNSMEMIGGYMQRKLGLTYTYYVI